MNINELYRELGAADIEDILRHFPSKYEDLHPQGNISCPKDRARVVVTGIPFSVVSINSRGASIVRFKIRSENTQLNCMLYNQSFYLQKLYKKTELLFVMTYSENRKCFMCTGIHDIDSYVAKSGLRPVYSLPKSVSSSYFTNYLKKILMTPGNRLHLESRIPERLREKYKLINLFDAFKYVHFPKDEKEMKEGLRVFKYEEALSYSTKSLMLKNKASSMKKKNSFFIDKEMINNKVKNLDYKLTKDQLIAIREIVTDMEKPNVMYRLLQGDVGTGKTIVALFSLYANCLRGKQGVLMSPTFELTNQHYKNALKFFEGTPYKVGILHNTQAMKSKERKELLQELKEGTLDVLVSTVAALGKDIEFKNLGLSIIDEQQLFGVRQRDDLLSKGDSDLLMMSATPIPRTLSQIILADLEVSTLESFPHGTRNVKTAVVRSQDPLIDKAIRKALDAGRQIFVVAPKIEEKEGSRSANDIYKEMVEFYGEDRCQLLHGRMSKEKQDEVYSAFASNKKPILISTTVIEVGIDVSRAALLVVYDANRFGLSSLHQLRGRIGRSGDFALALLVYDGNDMEASDKLSFLAECNDGFKISKYDLEMRGSGSYSGERQTGTSELAVCNFVKDEEIFKCAKNDAMEILENPSLEENKNYIISLDNKKTNIA